MRYLILGFVAAWFIPVWVAAVVLILMFLADATRKPTPKRRKR